MHSSNQLPLLTQEKKKTLRYNWDEVILNPPITGQPKAVLNFMIHKDWISDKNTQEIRDKWINDLEKHNPFLYLEDEDINFPSRSRSLKKIENVCIILANKH